MRDDHDLGGDAKKGTIISACEEQQTRGTRAVEGPCPVCGKIQEYFSDELRTKEKLRCFDCKETFDTEDFLKESSKS